MNKIQKVRNYICVLLQITKVHFTCYTRSNLRLFYLILAFCAVSVFKIRWILFLSRVLFFCLVINMIVSDEQQKSVQNVFYYVQNLILIIKKIKEMTFKQKYMTQREWVDYCTHRAFRMKKIIEEIWFWIKKRRLMNKISQKIQKFWERIFRHNFNNSTKSKFSKIDWWSHESYCETMKI